MSLLSLSRIDRVAHSTIGREAYPVENHVVSFNQLPSSIYLPSNPTSTSIKSNDFAENSLPLGEEDKMYTY